MKALILLNEKELRKDNCQIKGDISKPILVHFSKHTKSVFTLTKPLEGITFNGRGIEFLYTPEFSIVMELPND